MTRLCGMLREELEQDSLLNRRTIAQATSAGFRGGNGTSALHTNNRAAEIPFRCMKGKAYQRYGAGFIPLVYLSYVAFLWAWPAYILHRQRLIAHWGKIDKMDRIICVQISKKRLVE